MAYNSVDGLLASSGLRKAHAVGVPVNFRLRGAELAYVLRDSGASVVCAGPEFVEHVEAAQPELHERPSLVALGDRPERPSGWLAMRDLVADRPDDPPPEDPAFAGHGRTI